MTKAHHVKQWNLHTVVQELHRNEIMRLCQTLSGAKPGDHSYIGSYQVATKNFIADNMSDADRTEYLLKAEEWNKDGTPPETRRRFVVIFIEKLSHLTISYSLADKEAYGAIKDFTIQMRKRLGIWLFVLSAHLDPKGTVMFCKYV